MSTVGCEYTSLVARVVSAIPLFVSQWNDETSGKLQSSLLELGLSSLLGSGSQDAGPLSAVKVSKVSESQSVCVCKSQGPLGL